MACRVYRFSCNRIQDYVPLSECNQGADLDLGIFRKLSHATMLTGLLSASMPGMGALAVALGLSVLGFLYNWRLKRLQSGL